MYIYIYIYIYMYYDGLPTVWSNVLFACGLFTTSFRSSLCPLVLRSVGRGRPLSCKQRDWYFIAEQPAPEPHLAHSEG